MSRDDDQGRGRDAPKARVSAPTTGSIATKRRVEPAGPPEEVSVSFSANAPESGSFANVSFDELDAKDDEDGRPLSTTRRIRPEDIPSAPPRDARLGETLVGRYRIEKQIGKGGMGRVYQATQFPLNRAVAVKILSPEFQRKDPQFVRRFFLEAATAARLNHPNSITVYDYGETERGELFIAMEYLKGRPLSRVIAADGPFTADRCLHVSMQIIRALREAHSKGIVHRDLKPGNIMILDEGDDADFAKVLDFGLVKLVNTGVIDKEAYASLKSQDEGAELTRAGMFLGSPKYMSPEQIQGHELDPRTDIYSLGVIMYQMLAGRVPFRGNSSVEIIYKHVNQPVPAIHELNPEADVPPELELLVRRALAKKPDDRFASMGELLAATKDVRRLIVGNSSVGGGSIELISHYPNRDSVSVAAESPGPVSGSISVRSSLPTGRPAASSPPPAPPPALRSGPIQTIPPREIAFAESGVGEESKGELLTRAASEAARPSLLRFAPYVGAFGLLVGLGSAAYFLAAPAPAVTPPPPATPAPAPTPTPPPSRAEAPPPAAPARATLSFHSTPEGARVSEDGKLLGTTPFELEVERAGKVRAFVFEMDGFVSETVRENVDAESLKIRTTLRPVPREAPVARDPPRDPPPRRRDPPREPRPSTDYKDNPY